MAHLSVAGQVALHAAKELQILLREEAPLGQDGIEGGGAVALGENEPVPIRILGVLGVHVHDVKIQDRENVHGGKRAAQVTGRTVVHHVQAQKPPLGCGDLQRAHICFHIIASSYGPRMVVVRYSVTRKFSPVNSLSDLAIPFRFLYNDLCPGAAAPGQHQLIRV